MRGGARRVVELDASEEPGLVQMVGLYLKQQVAAALSFMKLIPTDAGEPCSLKARTGSLWLVPRNASALPDAKRAPRPHSLFRKNAHPVKQRL